MPKRALITSRRGMYGIGAGRYPTLSILYQTTARSGFRIRALSVSFSAVAHANNLYRVGAGLSEDHASVAYAKAILWRIESVQLFHISGVGPEEASKRFQ